jgi:Glyoxalase-like domain
MHRSRIAVVLIDHPTESYDAAAGFWAGVCGSQREPSSGPFAEDPYESLDRLPGGILLELQRTGSGTPPRVHLDVETDDVAAEVARLVGLGASLVEEREGYCVLQDPGGLVFCVVAIQTDRASFDENATAWAG